MGDDPEEEEEEEEKKDCGNGGGDDDGFCASVDGRGGGENVGVCALFSSARVGGGRVSGRVFKSASNSSSPSLKAGGV